VSSDHKSVGEVDSRSSPFPAIVSTFSSPSLPPFSASSPSLLPPGVSLEDDSAPVSVVTAAGGDRGTPGLRLSNDKEHQSQPDKQQLAGGDAATGEGQEERGRPKAPYKGPRHSELFIDQATRLQLQATLDSFARASSAGPTNHERVGASSDGRDDSKTSHAGPRGSVRKLQAEKRGRGATITNPEDHKAVSLQSRGGSIIKSVHKKPEKESLQLLLVRNSLSLSLGSECTQLTICYVRW
jgi:hypothetical protein